MITTQATIIRLTRLTDTSLIVHWFTDGHGLVKTVAKGARRPGSAFAGRIDLFFSGEIVYQSARRGELHALREVSIHQWREGLRSNYTSILLASYCSQLLEAVVEPGHPDPVLHDLLDRALNHMDASAPTMRALVHFEKELARILGISGPSRDATSALREWLGQLPRCREELFERLGSV